MVQIRGFGILLLITPPKNTTFNLTYAWLPMLVLLHGYLVSALHYLHIQKNTFKVVLATNGSNSFTIFQYIRIDWTTANTTAAQVSGHAQEDKLWMVCTKSSNKAHAYHILSVMYSSCKYCYRYIATANTTMAFGHKLQVWYILLLKT